MAKKKKKMKIFFINIFFLFLKMPNALKVLSSYFKAFLCSP